MRKIVIAIDGPAASGKSTTAKYVAERLGYLHIDTGAMYRAITLRVLEEGIPLDDEKRIRELAERCEIQLVRTPDSLRVYLDGRDVTKEIRTPAVTRAVSAVSSYQAVRDVLVREQRRMAAEGGVVLEGRDIGTTVLPQADLKVFMVAGVRERARRRRKELEQLGVQTDEVMLAKELEERDRLDATRTASPLQKAPDAVELDTSNLTIEQQVEIVVRMAKEIIHNKNERND